MKMGAFMLGGLAGAAAVIYLQRNRGNMMMSAMSSTSDSIGKIVDKGMSMVGANNSSTSSGSKQKSAASTSFESKTNADSAANMSKVEEIVKKDPSVKQQVDEILSENNQKSSAYQNH